MSTGPFNGGVNKSSQFDPGGVIKNVHDLHGQNLRVRDALSIAPDHWSHFSVAYDGQDRPTSVSYFRGTAPTKTTIQAFPDVAGSLQNKYFLIYSGFDNQKHHVWFNVDGTGVNPAPANSTGIEVAINANDTAAINAKAVQLTINMLFGAKFKSSVANSILYIDNINYGLFTASADFNTGFTVTTQDGANEEVASVSIGYDVDGNVLWQGQTLKNYYYDVYSGKFVRDTTVELSGVTVDVDLDGFSPTAPDSVQITGSEDGTETGTKYGVVYNKRQQVLDSHDRVADFTYADFGTKDQRITRIEYSSATFPGFVIRRDFSYTLISGRYRRDSEVWSEV